VECIKLVEALKANALWFFVLLILLILQKHHGWIF
jgi:hypothetical protein